MKKLKTFVMVFLAVVAGVSKGLLLVNPEIYTNRQDFDEFIDNQTLASLIATIILTTIMYTIFYMPARNKEINQITGTIPPLNFILLIILAGLTTIGFYFCLNNIFLAILISTAVIFFLYDAVNILLEKKVKLHIKLWKMFAIFNAYFVNILLFVGFAFNGINKVASIINGSDVPLISSSLNHMDFGIGIIMLVLGFGGMYSSRFNTAQAIVRICRKLTLTNLKNNTSIKNLCFLALSLAVGIQAGYQTFEPVCDLIASWGCSPLIATLSAIIVAAITAIAVSCLLYPKEINIKTNYFIVILAFLAAIITGMSTIPINSENLEDQILWSVMGLFATILWTAQLSKPKCLEKIPKEAVKAKYEKTQGSSNEKTQGSPNENCSHWIRYIRTFCGSCRPGSSS